ncbi:uncharacterized protein [Medicago truncatula]|uniref:uncharacterized protein n=1 Tax=Medicago truncatula TaxID=3880 RepID=UPI000D2F244F|nr:uncharacterized protein LOC11428647 [Medicago truncatula]
MAPDSEGDNWYTIVSSLPLKEEPTATKRQQSTTSTGTISSTLPTLRSELVEEILCSNASNSSSVTQTQLKCPISLNNYLEICSCDGILCFSFAGHSAFLWNPSLRRYNMLEISIGYDNFNDVYKVVAVSFFNDKNREVNVHTLGTNYWRRIQDFPYSQSIPGPGVFVSGTINWLIYDVSVSSGVEQEFLDDAAEVKWERSLGRRNDLS